MTVSATDSVAPVTRLANANSTEWLYGLHVERVSAVNVRCTATAPCAICGQVEAYRIFAIEGLPIWLVSCPSCQTGRLDPQPSAEVLSQYYPQDYYGDAGAKFSGLVERLVRFVGSRHARFLARHLPPQARVLDVGCGRGFALQLLADCSLECHGFEVTADAVRGIDPRVRVRVATSLTQAAYPDAHFDEVIVWHVLEHVPDPRGLLVEIHRVLKPNGVLVVAVPNFASWQARWAGSAWFHLDPPRHLFHFPLAGLKRLLSETGFHCSREHHFSLRQNPFGWIQSALNKFHGLPRNGIYVLLHRRAPHAPPPYSPAIRLLLRLLYCGLSPIGLGLSIVEAMFRSGATVHVVARRDELSNTPSASDY